uniref:Uncharacterized protein n=1 Tax=Arundo donax TaxID=35708 RepID=A0A0A9ANE8_ARUDO
MIMRCYKLSGIVHDLGLSNDDDSLVAMMINLMGSTLQSLFML